MILGNGFDIAHGLNSKYKDFWTFCNEALKGSTYSEETKEKIKNVLKYFPEQHEFWSDMESNITNLSNEGMNEFDFAWNVLRKNEFIYNILPKFYSELIFVLGEWVMQLDLSADKIKPKFNLDMDTYFINFNYTSTLVSVYKINKDKILYIHNEAIDAFLKLMLSINHDKNIIIGHSNILTDCVTNKKYVGNKWCDEYINLTIKPFSECKKNVDNFLANKQINSIKFYGFSFSKQDKPYIEFLLKKYPPKKAKWIIYYYANDKKMMIDNIEHCGVDINDVELIDSTLFS